MNETPKGVASPGPKGTRRVRGPGPDLGAGASTPARRLAAAILEVLAGSRTPLQAAQVLGLSLPRYYLLEVRALQGMLLACEPRRVGRVATAESALASLQRECEQLRRECARQQALVRAAQRAIGLAAPATPANKPVREGKKRRQRRPVARALRAAARLQPAAAAASPIVDNQEAVPG
jgi:erythromycin esterase-like protein